MAGKSFVIDYLTPIKEILADKSVDREKELRRFVYRTRKVRNRHIGRPYTFDQTIPKLLDPAWLPRVRRFDPDEWQIAADEIWKRATSILGRAPRPELVLYPGLNTFNGRVYKLDRRPVIGCAPDFPHTTGANLRILIAHEYGHFARWRRVGVPPETAPIFTNIFEEGWATWLSTRLLPEYNLGRLFMANLHGAIGMPDPTGGYLSWCRKNLGTIALGAQKVLKSKSQKSLGRFFQCRRLRDDRTPIRTGYYVGFRLIEMLAEEMTPRQLMNVRVTYRRMSGWFDELLPRAS